MLKAECPIWSMLTCYREDKERPLALALASMTGKSFRGWSGGGSWGREWVAAFVPAEALQQVAA